jgi:tryptophan-rich sensory protein
MVESIETVAEYSLLLTLTLVCFVDFLSGYGFALMRKYTESKWYSEVRERTWLHNKVPWQLFAAAWPAMYVLIIASIYLVYHTATEPFDHETRVVAWVFLASIVAGKCWTPAFFTMHWSYVCLALLVALEALNGVIQYYMWQGTYYTSFWMYFPYTVWCLVALLLTAEWCWHERAHVHEERAQLMNEQL